MKKLGTVCVLSLGLAVIALPSFAAEHNNGGLGFRTTDAPIGVRWWLAGQKAAIDANIGFGSQDAGEETLTRFTIDGGVPLVWKSWDQVHALFRPGIMFTSQDRLIVVDGETDTDSETTLAITAEIEAEVFVATNVSMSAAFGLGIFNTSPPGDGDSSTNFGLIGTNFTQLGFHIYLFGE